jgi:hypothetical protein
MKISIEISSPLVGEDGGEGEGRRIEALAGARHQVAGIL